MSNHTDLKKYFALFSIYLIISITFFSANALAAINYRISGENMVNKWRKADDVTIFYANASANVSIQKTPNTWQPMICTQQGNNSVTCEWFENKNNLGLTVSSVTWRFREESQPQLIVNATINIDRLPPTIEKLNITKIGSALKVVYSIKDHSYPGKIGCSGLDYITYVVGTESDTIKFNTTVCEYNGTVIFNESGFYQEDFPITLTAYDRLQQSVSNTTTRLVDLMGPDIQDEWQIMRGSQVIDILSSDTNDPTIKYDVVVYIQDPQLNINRVYADLSELNYNTVIKNTLRNKQASCILETEGTYKCTFSEIPIKPTNADIDIKVSAYDKSNNFANETLPKTVTILNDAGQVTYVGPLKEHCTASLSKCYTTQESQTFIAEIGLGSNFSALIFGFNGETKVGPCFPKEDKWECVYRYNVPDVSQLKVSVSALSADNYGNRLTYTDRDVFVDSDPPVIIGNITSNLPNCAVASDTLELTVIAKEIVSDVLKIHVDTSELTGADQTNGTCEKTVNDEWACTLLINGFVTEHPPELRKVIVEDLAGNKAEKDFKFEVCAEDSNAVPNYITKINPENDIRIDRRTASLLPIKTYVPLTITKSSSATIIEMTVDNCFAIDPDDETSEISVLDSGHYFIDNTLVLYAGFDGAVLPEDEFEINCTVNSRVRAGNKVFLKPEQDSFIIKVTPYNNPLGALDSSVNTKIADQKAALRDLDGEIELRKTIGGVFETICNLAQIIVKINNILQLIKSVVYAICVAMAASGVLSGVAESVWEFVGTTLNSIDITVQTYVWPTNILSGSVYGSAIKYTCLLYSCQHYKVSGLIEIGSAIDDLIGNAGVVKEKAGEAVTKEKQKQVDQVNQQKYAGEKKYYKDPQGKIHEVYIDKDGNKIAGSDKITTNPPVGELLKYEDVQKMPESKTTSPTTIVGEDYSTYMDECMDPTCNAKDNIYYPEETDNKNTKVEINPEITETKVPPIPPEIPIENPEKPPDAVVPEYNFIGNKEIKVNDPNKGSWSGLYDVFYREEDGKIVFYERSHGDSTGSFNRISGVDFEKYYGDGFDDYDSKAVADMLWKTKQEGWLANTHSGGITNDLKGEIDGKGRYRISQYRSDEVFGFVPSGTTYVKGIYSASDLAKHLQREKSNTLVTHKSYNIKVFKGGTNSGGTNAAGTVIADITGMAGGAGEPTEYDDGFSMSTEEMWGDIDDANQKYYERNLKFYSALDSEDWIINPYRSSHWDDLCAPAIVYNLQKEKQIRCKYVKCMETQLVAGMPSYICDRDYGMDACLYIDSAQWHVTGGQFFDNIIPGLLKSFFSTVINIGLYTGYSAACSNYLGGMGQGGTVYGGGAGAAQPVGHTTLVKGGWDVACGFLGTALQWNEITALGTGDFWSEFSKSEFPKDPVEINDYCEGVDYNE